MGLVDVYNPVVYSFTGGAVHLFLLIVNSVQHHQIFLFPGL
jgi:hypothetical protein